MNEVLHEYRLSKTPGAILLLIAVTMALNFGYGGLHKLALGDRDAEGLMLASVLFAVAGLAILRSLLFPHRYLRILSDGFDDNLGFHSIGFVPWTNIEALDLLEVHGNVFLTIILDEPEAFISKRRGLNRLLCSANHRFYASPVQINLRFLAGDSRKICQQMLATWQQETERPSSPVSHDLEEDDPAI